MVYRRLGNDHRFTRAGPNLELLPSSMMGDTFGPKGMEYAIATIPSVRDAITGAVFRAYVKSQARLGQIRARSGALGRDFEKRVSLTWQRPKKGRFVDGYLILKRNKATGEGQNDFINLIAIELGAEAQVFGRDREVDEGLERVLLGAGILHAGFDLHPGQLDGTGGGDI